VGNILEWYDFTVYGYFATVIGSLFSPSEDKIASLLAAFGVFAAGYLVRPLGGVFFGWPSGVRICAVFTLWNDPHHKGCNPVFH